MIHDLRETSEQRKYVFFFEFSGTELFKLSWMKSTASTISTL